MSFEGEFAGFVRENVRSVWALEMLLCLKRDPERCWSVEELVRDLRASQTLVITNLQSFEGSGLAMRDDAGCYRYAPAAPVLDALCGLLETAYRERPVATINLISKPADTVQSLADAFKFRGGPK